MANCYRCNKALERGSVGYCGIECYRKGPVYVDPYHAKMLNAEMTDEIKAANPYWNQPETA